MDWQKNILSALFVLVSVILNAQDIKVRKKHEIGVDAANILTFIKKNNQSYLVNYKYLIKERIKFRAGLNLDISDGKSESINPDLRIGIQKQNENGKWSLFYGLDASFRYFKNNSLDAYQYRYGLAPLFGVQYFIHDKISISTEGTLNFYYFNLRDKNSFDADANSDYFSLSIGSIGMIFIYYHF
jgi:hypothetical protein